MALVSLRRQRSALLLSGCDLANHLVRGAGFVDTEGLFGEKVAGGGVGAGAAPHADVGEIAAAPFALEVVVVAQLREDGRVVPDLGKTLFAQIAGQRRQVAAGEDLAFMREEADAGPSQAALGGGVHVARMSPGMSRVSRRRSAARL